MNKELEKELVTPPRALIRANPVLWLRFFGPGAIVASLTLGSGETLFASRGGTIFGYRILWVFLGVAFLKWVLAYSSIRHSEIKFTTPPIAVDPYSAEAAPLMTSTWPRSMGGICRGPSAPAWPPYRGSPSDRI